MGSQNVTKFSPKRMREIHAEIAEFDPESFQADQLVKSAGIATIGSLAKSSSFIQCMSSQSTAYGLELLISFAEQLRSNRTPERLASVLQKEYGVQPDLRRPLPRIMGRMTDILSVRLASKGEENDAAPAAKSAVTQTLIDVLSDAGQEDATDASQEEIASAFKGVRLERIASIFYENVITSLVNQSLDAARGKTPPAKVNELKEVVREKFAPELTKIVVNLGKRQGIDAVDLPAHLGKPKLLAAVKKQTDPWRRKGPKPTTEPIPGTTPTKKTKSQK